MPKADDAGTGRKRRYGVYTLGFLAFAFVMVFLSALQGHYTIVTALGVLVGLSGAAWCSFKGLRGLTNFRL
jgi:hypothetical protein